MKKLLSILLFVPLLFACSSDKEPEILAYEFYISNLDEVEDCIDKAIFEQCKGKPNSSDCREKTKESVKTPIVVYYYTEEEAIAGIPFHEKYLSQISESDCGIKCEIRKVDK